MTTVSRAEPMVVDSSAIIAIIARETDAVLYLAKLAAADVCRMSAATLVEVGMVAHRDRTGARYAEMRNLIRDYAMRVDPVEESHAWIALDAFSRFGKGTGHRAALNYGDCFSYALAKATGEPLLFKGNDFPHTDVLSVL